MLPSPASTTIRRHFPNLVSTAGRSSPLAFPAQSSRPRARWSSLLLARSPLTNAGVLILAAIAAFSIVLNLAYALQRSSPSASTGRDGRRVPQWKTPAGAFQRVPAVPGAAQVLPQSFPPSVLDRLHSVDRPEWTRHLSHLVIVPGHAVWKGSNPLLRMSDDEWILAPYQRGGGRVRAFFSHIVRGAELAVSNPEVLLVFSGGQTHSSSALTEAESYLQLALASNVFHTETAQGATQSGSHVILETPPIPDLPIFRRATTELYALDSYQNLLFSLARFHEVTGHYPENITVVGYEMKRRRFEELHRQAIRWPKSRFQYIGVGLEGVAIIPGAVQGGDAEAQQLEREDVERNAAIGELENAFLPYTKDMYGCHSPLSDKRQNRNPFMRFHPYFGSADGFSVQDKSELTATVNDKDGSSGADGRSIESETGSGLRGLLEWCPQDDWAAPYSASLPWDILD